MTAIKTVENNLATAVTPYSHSNLAQPLSPVERPHAVQDHFENDPSHDWRKFLGDENLANLQLEISSFKTEDQDWTLSTNSEFETLIDFETVERVSTDKIIAGETLQDLLICIAKDSSHLTMSF